MNVDCPECKGVGFVGQSPAPLKTGRMCFNCNGSGKIDYKKAVPQSTNSTDDLENIKFQEDLPDWYKPDGAIQRILVDAGIKCSLDNPDNFDKKPEEQPVCPLDLADAKIQAWSEERERVAKAKLVEGWLNWVESGGGHIDRVRLREQLKELQDPQEGATTVKEDV